MTDSRLQSTVLSALGRIAESGRAASTKAVETLERQLAAGSARTDADRSALQQAVIELRRKLPIFNAQLNTALRDLALKEVAPPSGGQRRFEATDWRSLSLVDEDETENRVLTERVALELGHDCEWELRELEGLVHGLQHAAPGDKSRNPLRPELVAQALLKASEAICDEKEARHILVREIGRAMSTSMRPTYAAIVDALKRSGVEPVEMAVRSVEGPGNEIARDSVISGYQTVRRESKVDMQAAQALSAMFGMAVPSGFGAMGTGGSGPSSLFGPTSGFGANGPGVGPGTGPGGVGGSTGSSASTLNDAQMLDVIRRLAMMATTSTPVSSATGLGGMPTGPGVGPGSGAGGLGGSSTRGGAEGLFAQQLPNLIRAHRDELVRMSSGALDHMIIDIVAALFDQVLADPKVPPQMARQIARLQLPVLRVALKDIGFFRSRRHPVRRFVNRLASLAAAIDDFDGGIGAELLGKVRKLVQEIIEGDFDQMGLYESKLAELEASVAEQAAGANGPQAEVAALLDGKESMLRVQQRYTIALRAQLAHVTVDDFARDFLSQVWSQVVVYALMRDGPDSALATRMKAVSRELILSLQPKGAPQDRKEFLLKLPRLMKDLNEGLDLIRWSDAAKKDFFSKLLPAHANALKVPPLTDFMQRQLKVQLDQVDKVPVPSAADVPPDSTAAVFAADPELNVPFSADEAAQVGLVDERTVDWDGSVDIDLGADTGLGGDESDLSDSGELDINLDAPPAPTHGVQLIHHMAPGTAYLMHIDKQGWRKVRLGWVSPGRGFFVFSYGRDQQKTISMTSRMLTRMLETQRFRAFERAELIERATVRARRQLAALGGPATRQ